MARKCAICTDQFMEARVDKCPKCIGLTELGHDRIAILKMHAKRIPSRRQRYLDRIEYLRSVKRLLVLTVQRALEPSILFGL